MQIQTHKAGFDLHELRIRTRRKKHSKNKLSNIAIYVSKRKNKQLKKAHSCGKIRFFIASLSNTHGV